MLTKHTLNPEMTLLCQFHAQKALFKIPEIWYINSLIENDPTPPSEIFFENSSDLAQPSFPKHSFKSAEMHLRHTEVAGCLQAPSSKSRILTTKFPWFRLIYLQSLGCDQLSDEAKVGFIFQDKSPPKLPAGKNEHSIMHNKRAKLMS